MPKPRRLTWKQACLIRDTKHSIKAGFWAEEFNVSKATISLIRSGLLYKTPAPSDNWGIPQSKDRKTVLFLKLLMSQGFSLSKAAACAGVSKDHAQKIRQGKRHAEVPWPNGRTGSMLDAYGAEHCVRIINDVFRYCNHGFRKAAQPYTNANTQRSEP